LWELKIAAISRDLAKRTAKWGFSVETKGSAVRENGKSLASSQ